MFDYERRINMNLFKKKEKKECCCSQIDQESIIKAEESKKEDGIKILGSGCKKCEKLEESVKKAVIELNLNLPISHITDFTQIASYGVMSVSYTHLDVYKRQQHLITVQQKYLYNIYHVNVLY